jgi:hypothetical protein
MGSVSGAGAKYMKNGLLGASDFWLRTQVIAWSVISVIVFFPEVGLYSFGVLVDGGIPLIGVPPMKP